MSPSHPMERPQNLLWIGLAELALCAFLVWRLVQLAQARGAVGDGFWGLLALLLFVCGLAQLHLVGYLRAALYRGSVRRAAHGSVRLFPYGAAHGLLWSFWSMALTFLAPIAPLVILLFSATTPWIIELSLLWIGCLLTCVVIGSITAWLGVVQLYQQWTGVRLQLELAADPIEAGQVFNGRLRYTPGRYAAERLELSLVCTMMRTLRTGSRASETKELVRDPLLSLDLRSISHAWEQAFAGQIPLSARASTGQRERTFIQWGLEARIQLAGRPDWLATFPFTVLAAPEEMDEGELDQEISEYPGD